jgi:uncharacterized protein YjbJ (UPF0337 family)
MFNIKENCNILKAKFQEQYTGVTDEDLKCNEDKPGEMLIKLQQKLGKSKEELQQIITNL